MQVEVAHRCAAPPQQVWEWVADPHKHIQMLPGSIRSARVRDDGDIEAELHAAGHRERMVVRVVSSDPPRRLEEERVDGVRAGRTVFTLEPDGDGCRVIISSEVDIPRMLAAVAKPKVVTSLREQLRNLDRLSSSGEM
jgi:carbon monoxide dehydrogenase subunit G